MRSVGLGLQVLRRLLYPQASAVVMQTKRGHDWLAAMAPKAPGRVIPNPVVYPLPTSEPQIAPDAVVPHDRKVLLAVGRLVEEKRFEWIVDGFAEIAGRHSRWDLVILGEGVERGALEGLVQKKGLGTRVHLPGRVGNLADWYRRADLYVLSSRFEGFPNTLVEAMAHGLPAVSVDCDTGPRDIINHDVDGWLVAADDDSRPLAYALDMLLSDPERCARLGQAAVAVRERFSIERIAAQWDCVLEQV
jgi:glycosyltransferase involved in cell wall biosynthesis